MHRFASRTCLGGDGKFLTFLGPIPRFTVFEAVAAEYRLRRAIKKCDLLYGGFTLPWKCYLPGTGIFLVGGFSAQPFKLRHRIQKPYLRVSASGRCFGSCEPDTWELGFASPVGLC